MGTDGRISLRLKFTVSAIMTVDKVYSISDNDCPQILFEIKTRYKCSVKTPNNNTII